VKVGLYAAASQADLKVGLYAADKSRHLSHGGFCQVPRIGSGCAPPLYPRSSSNPLFINGLPEARYGSAFWHSG
jgi:hypothetical protein